MTRLKELFARKNNNVLNIFFTAGYPKADSTLPLMELLEKSGVDIIELGMPYSDPLADGPVIQESSAVALNNGMSVPVLFAQLNDLRKRVQLPVILMGYLNPLLQYGFDKFCRQASEIGIDGLIIPDLPVEEFEEEYAAILKHYNLDFIFLITPETSVERISKLDSLSSGFLYAVASSSITGTDQNLANVAGYLERLHDMNLANPVLAGFGIKDKESFDAVCKYVNGGIIGSEFIKALGGDDDYEKVVTRFVGKIKQNAD